MSLVLPVQEKKYKSFISYIKRYFSGIENFKEGLSSYDVSWDGFEKKDDTYSIALSLKRPLLSRERKDKLEIVDSIFDGINKKLYSRAGKYAERIMARIGTLQESAQGISSDKVPDMRIYKSKEAAKNFIRRMK